MFYSKANIIFGISTQNYFHTLKFWEQLGSIKGNLTTSSGTYSDLENLKKSRSLPKRSGKMPQNVQSQRSWLIEIHFNEFKKPNFENFQGKHASTLPVNGFGSTAEFNLSLEKSWKSQEILSLMQSRNPTYQEEGNSKKCY